MFYNFVITILVCTGSRPLNAVNFVFCTDIVKPYSVIIWFNLYEAFCKLSSVSAIMTWSSANSSVDSCWFFESLILVMSWFCHLVIISSCVLKPYYNIVPNRVQLQIQVMLPKVQERGGNWSTNIRLLSTNTHLSVNQIKSHHQFTTKIYRHYVLFITCFGLLGHLQVILQNRQNTWGVNCDIMFYKRKWYLIVV